MATVNSFNERKFPRSNVKRAKKSFVRDAFVVYINADSCWIEFVGKQQLYTWDTTGAADWKKKRVKEASTAEELIPHCDSSFRLDCSTFSPPKPAAPKATATKRARVQRSQSTSRTRKPSNSAVADIEQAPKVALPAPPLSTPPLEVVQATVQATLQAAVDTTVEATEQAQESTSASASASTSASASSRRTSRPRKRQRPFTEKVVKQPTRESANATSGKAKTVEHQDGPEPEARRRITMEKPPQQSDTKPEGPEASTVGSSRRSRRATAGKRKSWLDEEDPMAAYEDEYDPHGKLKPRYGQQITFTKHSKTDMPSPPAHQRMRKASTNSIASADTDDSSAEEEGGCLLPPPTTARQRAAAASKGSKSIAVESNTKQKLKVKGGKAKPKAAACKVKVAVKAKPITASASALNEQELEDERELEADERELEREEEVMPGKAVTRAGRHTRPATRTSPSHAGMSKGAAKSFGLRKAKGTSKCKHLAGLEAHLEDVFKRVPNERHEGQSPLPSIWDLPMKDSSEQSSEVAASAKEGEVCQTSEPESLLGSSLVWHADNFQQRQPGHGHHLGGGTREAAIAREVAAKADEGGRGNRKHKAQRCQTKSAMIALLSQNDLGDHTLIKPLRHNKTNGEQPFAIKVHPNVCFICDFHAHLCESEIIGLLGGRWDEQEQVLYIQAAFPVPATPRADGDDGTTDVEMDGMAQLDTKLKAEHQGLQLVGWYHSHPLFQPDPSVVDIANHSLQQKQNSDGRPFVGLIVGTYDTSHVTPSSIFRWFHTVTEQQGYGKLVELPMELDADVLICNPPDNRTSVEVAEAEQDRIAELEHRQLLSINDRMRIQNDHREAAGIPKVPLKLPKITDEEATRIAEAAAAAEAEAAAAVLPHSPSPAEHVAPSTQSVSPRATAAAAAATFAVLVDDEVGESSVQHDVTPMKLGGKASRHESTQAERDAAKDHEGDGAKDQKHDDSQVDGISSNRMPNVAAAAPGIFYCGEPDMEVDIMQPTDLECAQISGPRWQQHHQQRALVQHQQRELQAQQAQAAAPQQHQPSSTPQVLPKQPIQPGAMNGLGCAEQQQQDEGEQDEGGVEKGQVNSTPTVVAEANGSEHMEPRVNGNGKEQHEQQEQASPGNEADQTRKAATSNGNGNGNFNGNGSSSPTADQDKPKTTVVSQPIVHDVQGSDEEDASVPHVPHEGERKTATRDTISPPDCNDRREKLPEHLPRPNEIENRTALAGIGGSKMADPRQLLVTCVHSVEELSRGLYAQLANAPLLVLSSELEQLITHTYGKETQLLAASIVSLASYYAHEPNRVPFHTEWKKNILKGQKVAEALAVWLPSLQIPEREQLSWLRDVCQFLFARWGESMQLEKKNKKEKVVSC
ncbi:unnamed protein product [Chrysoparadoxa australica]